MQAPALLVLLAVARPAGGIVAERGDGGGAWPDLSSLFGGGKADEAAKSRAWQNRSLTSDQRTELLLQAMQQNEKARLLAGRCVSCPYVGLVPGNERLGIPPLNEHDGPQGFRNMPGARGTTTSWPGAMAMTATWDPEAVQEWGVGMGQEFRDKGSNVQLGPGFNVARVPRNGRNFEYMSGEDPYLGYVLSGPATRGIQSQKVIACGKHYVVNSEETHRMDGSEDVDERTLFEMYYPPFAGAVEAGLGAIMCSYNKINDVWGCENPTTLKEHLRGKLGFKGFVMSDWGATVHMTGANHLRSGLDQEMPFPVRSNPISNLIEGVKAPDVTDAARHVLRTMFEVGVMDEPQGTWAPEKFKRNVTSAEHDALARRFSAESTVLMKNEGGVLPLPQDRGVKLLLAGFAAENAYQLSYGHGSGEVAPSYLVTPLEGISAAAHEESTVTFDKGMDLESLAKKAAEADYAVVFVGASASEGGDRKSLSLDGSCRMGMIQCDGPDDNQNAMVEAVAKANPRTIVVLSVPGAILMPWAGQVQAILTNWMPGQQVGNAIADVLFGKVNPSAKLPITMPNRENEVDFSARQFPGVKNSPFQLTYHVTYEERLLVGYRYYDAHDIQFTTGFPFGHGLSYTTFSYDDLALEGRTVSFTVTNTGTVPGREVAQLYLGFPASAGEPPLQLKGFKKIEELAPGASARVTLELTDRDQSIWDTSVHDWQKVHGSFRVGVGASSRDLRLEGSLDL